MANGMHTQARTSRARRTRTPRNQAAVRPVVPAAEDSGRAPSTDSPPSCGGTPGTAPEPLRWAPGRMAAAILTAIRAGDLEAAEELIDSLDGDPAQDRVRALVLSAGVATDPRRGQ